MGNWIKPKANSDTWVDESAIVSIGKERTGALYFYTNTASHPKIEVDKSVFDDFISKISGVNKPAKTGAAPPPRDKAPGKVTPVPKKEKKDK